MTIVFYEKHLSGRTIICDAPQSINCQGGGITLSSLPLGNMEPCYVQTCYVQTYNVQTWYVQTWFIPRSFLSLVNLKLHTISRYILVSCYLIALLVTTLHRIYSQYVDSQHVNILQCLIASELVSLLRLTLVLSNVLLRPYSYSMTVVVIRFNYTVIIPLKN